MQVSAESAGVVGGVADEGGQAAGEDLFLAAGWPVGEEGEHLGELGCVAGSRVMPGMAVGSVRWWRVQFRRAG